MKTTRHFEDRLSQDRPYLRREWCERALAKPVRVEVQPDGRVRHWVYIIELGKYIRVVTLADGETVLTAFPDSRFRE